ncbi:MAG: hypothetical protein KGI98_08955 [Euryarchaeota archaeon]|nr:hypothetical protein [Euryarchaeota archaeon]MDE1881443.1 hypothetical protein [Euryarchaeota archaeon]
MTNECLEAPEKPPIEVVSVVRTDRYQIPLRTAAWITMLETVVLAALYAILGTPARLDRSVLDYAAANAGSFASDMFFHGIGVCVAALATYAAVHIFDLQRFEPPLDFPLHYRAWTAAGLAGIGSLFYLNSALNAWATNLGLVFLLGGFLMILDAGGALFWEMWLLPAKCDGSYDWNANYLYRMLPLTRARLRSFLHSDVSWWLGMASITGALVAGVMGFVLLWVNYLGVGFLVGWVSYFGFPDVATFTLGLVDPHSHLMAVALLGGLMALVAIRFRVLDASVGWRKRLAQGGLWLAWVGVLYALVIQTASAAFNYAIPALVVTDPASGTGFMADDAGMAFVGYGAMALLLPLALATYHGKSSYRDPVRLAMLGTAISAFLINVVNGFWISFNENLFQNGLSANDTAHAMIHPFSFFAMGGLAVSLLIVDYYQVGGTLRNVIGALSGVGVMVATVGAYLWTFVHPSPQGWAADVFVAGLALVGAGVLFATWGISRARTVAIRRVVPASGPGVGEVYEEVEPGPTRPQGAVSGESIGGFPT